VPNLVWRVKLVAGLRPGVVKETEVARIEREEFAGLADLGLRLAERQQLTTAFHAEFGAGAGGRRGCAQSLLLVLRMQASQQGPLLPNVPLFVRDVPVRVRRLLACPCQGQGEAKGFCVLDRAMMGLHQSWPTSPPAMQR
jgi:hypothetical protein